MKFKFAALWLSGACILVFILQKIFGTDSFSLIKPQMWSQPWRIVTAIFAHESIQHLGANILGLALFGLVLEGRIGPKKVLALFLGSGVLVNIFTFYPNSLGASGAIFAIIGALTILRPFMVIWVSYIPMPMAVAALFWLAQDVIRTIVPSSIGSLAHMGGLGIGIATGIYWRFKGLGDKIKIEKREKDPELERQLDEWEKENMKS